VHEVSCIIQRLLDEGSVIEDEAFLLFSYSLLKVTVKGQLLW